MTDSDNITNFSNTASPSNPYTYYRSLEEEEPTNNMVYWGSNLQSQNQPVQTAEEPLSTVVNIPTVKIGLLNVTGLKNNYEILKHTAKGLNLDVLALTETWHLANSRKYHGTFAMTEQITPPRKGCRPERGVGFLLFRDLEANIIAVDHIDRCFSIIDLGTAVIAVVYLPPQSEHQALCERIMEQVIIECLTVNKPTVILGDFNARSMAFGDRLDNPRGVWLKQFIDSHNIQLETMGGNITYSRYVL